MKYILIIWILTNSQVPAPSGPLMVAIYSYQSDCVVAAQEWSKQKDGNVGIYRSACLPVMP